VVYCNCYGGYAEWVCCNCYGGHAERGVLQLLCRTHRTLCIAIVMEDMIAIELLWRIHRMWCIAIVMEDTTNFVYSYC
jgi:hypothetical protein